MQALVSRYPWFSYAREVLLCRLVAIEPECLESNYRENLIFFPQRDQVLLKSRSIIANARAAGINEEGFEIDCDLMLQEAESFALPQTSEEDIIIEEQPKITNEAKPKVFVVGGDYFTREDFEELGKEERVPEIKLGAPADNVDRTESPVSGDMAVDFESMDFVTETLAAIYADQGYYDKAIDAYAKLILLYPEKSTYFASLVNEIKSKN